MSSEIRSGQLIAPFGPGSIYTDKHGSPNLICGLDFWYKSENDNQEWSIIEAAANKYTIEEPRLSELLKIPTFRQPPQSVINDPELSKLFVQTHRFPRWYYDNTSGKLKKFNLESKKLEPYGTKSNWRPVRFISVCTHGHISDFPWKSWCGCTCADEDGLTLHDSGGPDLGSVKVTCTNCRKSKTLAGAMNFNVDEITKSISESGLQSANIHCGGERPWLGYTSEPCSEKLVAVLINQSNIYFGRTISSIYLPELNSSNDITRIQKVFSKHESTMNQVKLLNNVGLKSIALVTLKDLLETDFQPLPEDDVISQAFETLGRGDRTSLKTSPPLDKDTSALAFRRAEYNILRNEVPPEKSDELRIITTTVPDSCSRWFNKINLVERLRETKVFYGFDRLIRQPSPLDGMPRSAMNQLFLHVPDNKEEWWLPAVKNYGEGIYIELSESSISEWLEDNNEWLRKRIDDKFISCLAEQDFLNPPLLKKNQDWKWAARYLLVHTLSHILINQMVFESGYSSAALKERIYVSNDSAAPMAAFLIYTASGDSEGSLGGLVRLGREELFDPMIHKAISRASWCSADPVCSENMGGAGSQKTNKSACHACVLLPETACETINSGLDRAMVVGIPENQVVGFLSDLLKQHV